MKTARAHSPLAHRVPFTLRQPFGKRRGPTQVGDKVRFRISDVFIPSPEGVFSAPPSQETVEGTILDFSDSGQKIRFFALVDVVRRMTVVVPVEKLQSVTGPEASS
jgi:hypothetical protein